MLFYTRFSIWRTKSPSICARTPSSGFRKQIKATKKDSLNPIHQKRSFFFKGSGVTTAMVRANECVAVMHVALVRTLEGCGSMRSLRGNCFPAIHQSVSSGNPVTAHGVIPDRHGRPFSLFLSRGLYALKGCRWMFGKIVICPSSTGCKDGSCTVLQH